MRFDFGSRGGRRRGATAVEFALTAPILFVIVLGAIEFSRANLLLHTASIAAAEGARAAIVDGATAADCRAAATSELTMLGVRDSTVAIAPAVIDDSVDQVTVNVTVPLTMRNGYVLPRFFLGKEIFKSVTLQREGRAGGAASEAVDRDGVQNTPR